MCVVLMVWGVLGLVCSVGEWGGMWDENIFFYVCVFVDIRIVCGLWIVGRVKLFLVCGVFWEYVFCMEWFVVRLKVVRVEVRVILDFNGFWFG